MMEPHPRECTSDYSSMDNGLNFNGGGVAMAMRGGTGFENPNYHGSGSSTLFQNHKKVVEETFEMGKNFFCLSSNTDMLYGLTFDIPIDEIGPNDPKSSSKGDPSSSSYYYQVSTPNYMLLIGGNESHSSQVVSKRQPLSIWRLRVTRDLFGSNSAGSMSTQPPQEYSAPSSSRRPSSSGSQRRMNGSLSMSNTTTGF